MLEVIVHTEDAGIGTGHPITWQDGRLVGADPFAEDVIRGQRIRHPGLSDAELVEAINGWSNGWIGIRVTSPSL